MTDDRDALTAVSGTPLKVDATEGAPFTATIPNTVSLANGAWSSSQISRRSLLKSPDLMRLVWTRA